MNEDQLNNLIDKRAKDVVKKYLAQEGFTARKLTDTPTDKNSLVPRGYITNNGILRPTSSVIGQPFFDTSLASGRGKLITWNGSGWVDGSGTFV